MLWWGGQGHSSLKCRVPGACPGPHRDSCPSKQTGSHKHHVSTLQHSPGKRPGKYLWERIEFPSAPKRWGWWLWAREGGEWREEGQQAHIPTSASPPHTHTHRDGNSLPEPEARGKYTRKDMTSIFFQVNVSLPVGGSWRRRRREKERAGQGGRTSPGEDSRPCSAVLLLELSLGTGTLLSGPPGHTTPSLGLSSPISSSHLKPLSAIYTTAGISPRKPEWTALKSCPGTWVRIWGGRHQLGVPGCYHIDQASHIYPAHLCFHCSLCHCPLLGLEKYI